MPDPYANRFAIGSPADWVLEAIRQAMVGHLLSCNQPTNGSSQGATAEN